MKVTKREFRIAAVASFVGFFCCYFLVGQPTPPRGLWQMTVIYDGPAAPKQLLQEIQPILIRTNAAAPRFVPAFAVNERPELAGSQPGPRIDLMSSRYKAEVDVSDLQ